MVKLENAKIHLSPKNSFYPVVLSEFLRDRYFCLNAEHFCTAYGGAFPKFISETFQKQNDVS